MTIHMRIWAAFRTNIFVYRSSRDLSLFVSASDGSATIDPGSQVLPRSMLSRKARNG